MGTDDLATSEPGPPDPAPGPEPADRLRLKSFPGGVVVGAVVAVAVTLLIIQNGESTQLEWLAFHFEAPLWIMLLLTLVAGGFIAEVGKVAVRKSLATAKKRRATTKNKSIETGVDPAGR